MYGRALLLLLLAALVVGCDADVTTEETAREPVRPTAPAFDSATTGCLSGIVTWKGPVPSLPAIHFNPATLDPTSTAAPSTHAQPCLPHVDSATGALAGAVVLLRGIDAARARPWNHGPVRIEFVDRELRIVQDGATGHTGFVRVGDTIEVVRRGTEYCGVQARGAAFFALPLPDADRPRRRRLDRAGVVDLSSSAGHWWQRAHLFVADHPYQTRSDAQGRFTLEQVPAGSYEIVCWLPNWTARRRERDPESSFVARLELAPPREISQPVTVRPGQDAHVAFTWDAGVFRAAPLSD